MQKLKAFVVARKTDRLSTLSQPRQRSSLKQACQASTQAAPNELKVSSMSEAIKPTYLPAPEQGKSDYR